MKDILVRVVNFYKTSLTVKTLFNMSLRVALVVLASTTVSYLHVMQNLETQTVQQLDRYITERGQRESTIFQLAEDNLTSLRERFLTELDQVSGQDISAEFDQTFFTWNDGETRNFPGDRPISEFDTTRQATSFINRTTRITTALKRQLLTAQRLITSYGPAWSNRFINTYLNTVENTTTIYWRDTPLALQAEPDFAPSQDEYLYIADPEHNPHREPVWTGTYADTVTGVWMVSAVVPLYEGDRFSGAFGHDIKLDKLIEQTINNNLPGAYNVIFSQSGRLIAHPQYIQRIQQSQGQLNIDDLNDNHLQQIFQLSLATPEGVIENKEDQEFIAVTQLAGPDWFFATIYPKALLSESALDTIKFVFAAGLAALLIEVALLLFVLKNQITNPLNYLTTASQKLADGDFEVDLKINRRDELGQLASSFLQMAHRLQNAFRNLQEKITEKEQAEELILEKNNALEQALTQVQRMQLQTVQNEKMAALGNLVAGVAHEINNPVGFLNGSIDNAKDYMQDLFDYLNVYHNQHPPNDLVQENAEDIDLEFLLEDLPKLLDSMQGATDRIQGISNSLRIFSRADAEYKVSANLHEGLDSTLLILKYRLKANDLRPAIEVIQQYGDLPKIDCFPGQLNQVFMNIVANAIDMFDEMAQATTFENLKSNPQKITIQTEIVEKNSIEIRIADNGKGMSEAVKSRIFDHLFTTKGVGEGTGLGLAIAHQIIVEKHGGTITAESEIDEGTTFVINLPIGAA
ncbi:MAG: ATP-binding protein [Cyanobacteria bacterium P01_C01_bin.70]